MASASIQGNRPGCQYGQSGPAFLSADGRYGEPGFKAAGTDQSRWERKLSCQKPPTFAGWNRDCWQNGRPCDPCRQPPLKARAKTGSDLRASMINMVSTHKWHLKTCSVLPYPIRLPQTYFLCRQRSFLEKPPWAQAQSPYRVPGLPENLYR